MYRKKGLIVKNIFWPIAAVLFLLVLWLIASLAYNNPLILPVPSNVFSTAFEMLGERFFWQSFFSSLTRCFFSLLMSFCTALVLAVFSVLYRGLFKLLAPIVTVLRAVPTMSIIFVLLLMFSPRTAPIFVTFMVVMPSMYSMLISAFLGVNKELVETGRVFGLNKFGLIKDIYVPVTLPVMVEAVSSGFSLSFKILVAAEVLSSTAQSMGYMLRLANLNIQVSRLLALTLVAVVLCLIVEFGLRLLSEKLSKDLY